MTAAALFKVTFRTAVKRTTGAFIRKQLDESMQSVRMVSVVLVDNSIRVGRERPNSTQFEFRVARPGYNLNVAVDDTGRAKVEETRINTWGVMRVLHTFTGVRANDTRNQRDWALTTLWVLSMDAVSVGMIVMVFGGLYMWYVLPAKRNGGSVALLLGTGVCCVFVLYALFFVRLRGTRRDRCPCRSDARRGRAPRPAAWP